MNVDHLQFGWFTWIAWKKRYGITNLGDTLQEIMQLENKLSCFYEMLYFIYEQILNWLDNAKWLYIPAFWLSSWSRINQISVKA